MQMFFLYGSIYVPANFQCKIGFYNAQKTMVEIFKSFITNFELIKLLTIRKILLFRKVQFANHFGWEDSYELPPGKHQSFLSAIEYLNFNWFDNFYKLGSRTQSTIFMRKKSLQIRTKSTKFPEDI